MRSAIVAIAPQRPYSSQEGQYEGIISGTGFNTTDDGLIVTAAHLFRKEYGYEPDQPAYAMFVRTGEEGVDLDEVPLGKPWFHPELDVAVVRIADGAVKAPLPYLKIRDGERVWEGQEVAFCGFPRGHELKAVVIYPSFRRAMISAVLPALGGGYEDPRLLRLDVIGNPGESGAPLFLPESGAFGGLFIERVSHMYHLPGPAGESLEPIELPTGLSNAYGASVVLEALTMYRAGHPGAGTPQGS